MRLNMRLYVAGSGSLFLAAIVGCASSGSTSGNPATAAAAPQFSPASGVYPTPQTVTLSDTTAGAVIYYTTDGSVPTTSSKPYSGAISVSGSQMIQALASAPQGTPSAVANASYTIAPPVVNASSFHFGSVTVNTAVTDTVATITNNDATASPIALSITGDPSFTLVTGKSCGAQLVPNASCPIVIAYDPTAAGTQTGTVSVQFTAGSGTPSVVALTGDAAAPAPGPIAATPQFSLTPGIYSTSQTVTIGDVTAGATLYYTTDGSVPTTGSSQYSGPISVSGSEVIQALATAPNYTTSAVASASYTIIPPTVSGNSFDFGQDLVNTTLTKTVATVTNNGPTAAPVTLSISGDASFTLVPGQTCGAQVPANSTCPIVVAYDPATDGIQKGSVGVQFVGGSPTPAAISLTGTSATTAPGTVTNTINPQVALYTIAPPSAANVTVEFGPTTSYGFSTSAKPTPANGGSVGVLVAGMIQNTLYHMRATVAFANGQTFVDSDHTFTTGPVPAGIVPPGSVSTTNGLTPQPGIELIDTIIGHTAQTAALAIDLSGNVLWTYPFPDRQPTSLLYPIKPMPNGNLIMELGPVSQSIVSGPVPPGSLVVLREIDLAGNTVQELSMAQLNARLAAAGFTGLTLQLFSHDLALLPNGHILVNTNTIKPFTNLPGYPGTTNVVGDVIVDLDQNMNPVWVWNEFDHFDVNRHPMGFPDWTHTNGVIYSPDDGNILVSIRHQNWVVKVNYNNGAGDGSVIWKLGYQGDFKLQGGTDPTDWFYAQHNPAFFSKNTTGIFSLGVMDNGDDRVFPDGTNCQVQGGSLCYTTIPVMQIDESAKTATLTFHQILPPNLYSSFAGDILQLANSNVEYNLAGVGNDSYVFEVTPVANPTTVWQLHINGTNTYRAYRIPSLYPGVTW